MLGEHILPPWQENGWLSGHSAKTNEIGRNVSAHTLPNGVLTCSLSSGQVGPLSAVDDDLGPGSPGDQTEVEE